MTIFAYVNQNCIDNMTFNTYGDRKNQSLLLIPGLGVSYEIFLPLIDLLKDKYCIVAVGIDGFLLGQESKFPFSGRENPDAAPLLPLPKWLVDPLRYYQSWNVWTCYHWTGFWRWVFHSHYFDVLLNECRKVWPYGKGKAVRDGYKDVYTQKLESIHGADIHYWHGTLEAFVAPGFCAPAGRFCLLVHGSEP